MQHWSGFKELGSFGIVCRYVCIEHYPLERHYSALWNGHRSPLSPNSSDPGFRAQRNSFIGPRRDQCEGLRSGLLRGCKQLR